MDYDYALSVVKNIHIFSNNNIMFTIDAKELD